jgi:3-deoxy-D-manno-octulosonic-acid transferase
MNFLYTLSQYLYLAGIALSSLFNPKARRWLEGRRGWYGELKKRLPHHGERFWFHCASLGEFEQGRPVIEAFRKRFPHDTIILTFFSPSGYEIRKDYDQADVVMYLPADLKINARRFVRAVNPRAAFFIKYEFWFNYLVELGRSGIPFFLVSGKFRSHQYFFSWYGRWFLERLKHFSWFFVQDEASLSLLARAGITAASVAGDTRFDRVSAVLELKRTFPLIESFKGDSRLLVAGSTWPPDEEKLADLFGSERLKFVIAPHEVGAGRIDSIIALAGSKAVRYSETDMFRIRNARVLVIDEVGFLSHLYCYADIAYIGGGFGKGIHNILEAAAFGCPLVFGPRYQKFGEATDLVGQGGAFAVHNASGLVEKIRELLDDEQLRLTCSGICSGYVSANRGATDRILSRVVSILGL